MRLKKKLSEKDAKKYVCELILAIEHLHKNKIIYRDLKPENVALNAEGHIKLIDFGLSKQLDVLAQENTSFVGAIAYLAPEILKK